MKTILRERFGQNTMPNTKTMLTNKNKYCFGYLYVFTLSVDFSVAAQKMLTPGGNILAELDMNLTEEQYQLFYSPPELWVVKSKVKVKNRPHQRSIIHVQI